MFLKTMGYGDLKPFLTWWGSLVRVQSRLPISLFLSPGFLYVRTLRVNLGAYVPISS